MKSRTSSFNLTIFRKDITRFAPVWALYGVYLLMALMVIYNSHDVTEGVVGFGYWAVIANFVYAMVCAQVLFGDLFHSRMCNAIHALPLRRESWFGIHVLAGLCFSLIPNLVFTLLLAPGCDYGAHWFWLAQSTLQFVFYFGTAVLCVQLVGSRFAMAVVYGLLNFGSLVVYWLLDTLYVPLLPGVILSDEIFQLMCPVMNLFIYSPVEMTYRAPFIPVHSVDGWIYLAILAAVGVVLGVAALMLYRRRNLETAGDFIAVGALKPVFLVSYTFVITAFFQLVSQLFLESDQLLMLLGIAVGYFTGQMFLTRTTKVFKKKTLIGFAVFTAAVIVSLGITLWDPLGITRWVPEQEDVASVMVEQNGLTGEFSDHAALEQIEDFHRAVSLDYRGTEDLQANRIRLTYTLKNGFTAQREYWISDHSDEGELLRPVISSPSFVLQGFEKDWQTMGMGFRIGYYHSSTDDLVPRDLYPELMACLIKDCQEGNLPQNWWEWNDADVVFEMHMEYQNSYNSYRYCNLTVTKRAEHTYTWLKQQEFYQFWLKHRYD